jgi:hypothetical protein
LKIIPTKSRRRNETALKRSTFLKKCAGLAANQKDVNGGIIVD